MLATCLLLLCTLAPTMASMPGAAKEISGASNREDVVEAAKFAVEQHGQTENSGIKLLKVLSASKQVVAGTLLKLRLLIADGENAVEYEAKVWEKPWENFRQVTEFKAVPDSSRALSAVELEAANDGKMLPTMADDDAAAASSGMGASEALLESVPPSDPAVQLAAEKAVAALQQRSNSLFPLQLQSVRAAALQRDFEEDGGVTFHLDLELVRGPTNAVETKVVDVTMTSGGRWSSVQVKEG